KVGKTITHFTIHWSVGKPEAGATEEQMSLLRSIYNEVEEKMFDYISIKNTKNLEKMRANVIKIKEINKMVNNKLSSEKAKELISEAKTIYHELEYMLKNDKNIRDKSIYFNWLEDDELIVGLKLIFIACMSFYNKHEQNLAYFNKKLLYRLFAVLNKI